MGECFEILNILVEVLVLGKGQGSMGPSRQYLKTNTAQPFQMVSMTRPTVCDISARNVIGLLKIDFNYLANYFCWSLNSLNT